MPDYYNSDNYNRPQQPAQAPQIPNIPQPPAPGPVSYTQLTLPTNRIV